MKEEDKYSIDRIIQSFKFFKDVKYDNTQKNPEIMKLMIKEQEERIAEMN